MPKNIVICSDGTGNTAIKGRGSNVFKLYEAVDLIGHKIDRSLAPQIAIYDDGVGNEDFKPLKLFAGITGFGLARNVRLLYKALVRVYDPGDRIFLFGFSRGAFTVRTLSGLIAVCGILDIASLPTTEALDRAVNRAYRAYRQEYHTKLATLLGREGNKKLIARFQQRYICHRNVRIRFIGAWETVDAVGAPWHIGDYINATIGFHELAAITNHSPKSLMRMLGPSGNPYARNLFEIVSCLQKKTGVHFQLKALAATAGR